ncbi:putative RNA-directed DNA polymerase, eukaryota, reverse transcriptase zinc-binding domain protein [Tanacetum coccineum]|uniref:RNA-directed DNA polymerase, eukaryota, reverse transcriptase zinc-binding domain protein n=1 Tax=Tanacetum coccineum TaxID=301880 RepID=A0ABQ5C0M8_9ASTR
MACVSYASYSLCINGDLHRYFKGRRGLRQGDPMSPYLFTLVMEVLMLILMRQVRNNEDFQYHNYCHKQKIINVCFADDLILLARGDVNSPRTIMEALEEFKVVSDIEQLMRRFLWCHGKMKRGKDKVAWDTLCLHKYEGGLGNGLKTSFSFDSWNKQGPLRGHFTVRNITRECFNLRETIAEVCSNGTWKLPDAWANLHHVPSNLEDITSLRNKRLYAKDNRKEELICGVIIEIVRLKILSLRFKPMEKVLKTLQSSS